MDWAADEVGAKAGSQMAYSLSLAAPPTSLPFPALPSAGGQRTGLAGLRRDSEAQQRGSQVDVASSCPPGWTFLGRCLDLGLNLTSKPGVEMETYNHGY